MIKILTISLGLPTQLLGFNVSGEVIAVAICFVITVAYSAGAGMWAVLWTDLVQFVIKMTAVIILAVYSVRAVGGMDKLKAELAEHFGQATQRCLYCRCRSPPADSKHTRGCRFSRSACSSRFNGGPHGIRAPSRAAVATSRSEFSRQDRARRRARDAVLPGRALRDQAVAVDHHRPLHRHSLPERLGRHTIIEAAYVQAFVDLSADAVARVS